MDIIVSSISSIANYVLKDLQNSNLQATIQSKLDKEMSVHQYMMEDIYLSSLRSYWDNISMGEYEAAIQSIMDLSNREATPKVNYLLAMALVKCGKEQLAKQKLKEALLMNPFMDCSEPYLENDYHVEPVSYNWSIIPYTIDDTISNKVLRRLGIDINEGVSKIEVCSSGGDILYLIKAQNDVEFGLIDINTGHIIWKTSRKDDVDIEIIANTPYYSILKYKDTYEFYKRKETCVARLSKYSFNILFSTDAELLKISKYKMSSVIDENSSVMEIPAISSKKISIIPIKHKKHRYWKTDGHQPHPGIDFDPVIYWAMNVRLEIN